MDYVRSNHFEYAPATPVSDYEALVRAIIGQQLSSLASRAIFERLLRLIGGVPVTPASLIKTPVEELSMIGLSKQKIAYITDIGQSLINGTLHLGKIHASNDHGAIEQLTAIKGVGQWTAEMFAIFQMGRQDIFPLQDVGIRNAMRKLYHLPPTTKDCEFLEIATHWRPHRSIACQFLWLGLDTGYFGQ